MDGDLKRTVQFLLDRNVAVVVHNQHDLNLVRIREEKAKASHIGKEKASSSSKGKANGTSQVASNNDVLSKAALAQRARRQRERDERQQIVQHTRPERDKSGECTQPIQPTCFPALIPSHRRAVLERARMTAIKGDVIQLPSVSTKNTETAPQRTMVSNAPGSSCTTTILSHAPKLVDYSINRSSPLFMKNILSQPRRSDQVGLHSLPPPRNLGLEPGRRVVQQGFHFMALGGTSSSTPWNVALNNNGGNKHLINPGQRFELELGRRRFQDIRGKYASCPRSKHRLFKPEIYLKQTPMRPTYVHFVPVATTNNIAPVMTVSHGGPVVHDSVVKPGIALHAIQSDSLKVTSEGPHSIGSKGSDDMQRAERFFCLTNLLKQLDESDQKDYKGRLLHLPPAEIRQHATELQKRAVQLTIEEGKEMQRVKALNVLGNLV